MTDYLGTRYNPAFFERLCPLLKERIPAFDDRDFVFRVFNNKWPDLQPEERARHIARVLHHFLEEDFRLAAQQLIGIAHALGSVKAYHSPLEYLFLLEYLELFGDGHLEESTEARQQIQTLCRRDEHPIELHTEHSF